MNYSELVQLNKLREKAKEKGRQDIVDEINELFASVEEEPSYLSREDRMLAGEQRAEAEQEQYQELLRNRDQLKGLLDDAKRKGRDDLLPELMTVQKEIDAEIFDMEDLSEEVIGLGLAATESLTVGFVGDETAARLRSTATGENYEDSLKEIRRIQADFAEDNPLVDMGVRIAAGFVPATRLAKFAGVGTTAAGGAARQAGVTSAEIGTYAFLETEGDVEKRLEGVVETMTDPLVVGITAVAGTGGGLLGRAVGKDLELDASLREATEKLEERAIASRLGRETSEQRKDILKEAQANADEKVLNYYNQNGTMPDNRALAGIYNQVSQEIQTPMIRVMRMDEAGNLNYTKQTIDNVKARTKENIRFKSDFESRRDKGLLNNFYETYVQSLVNVAKNRVGSRFSGDMQRMATNMAQNQQTYDTAFNTAPVRAFTRAMKEDEKTGNVMAALLNFSNVKNIAPDVRQAEFEKFKDMLTEEQFKGYQILAKLKADQASDYRKYVFRDLPEDPLYFPSQKLSQIEEAKIYRQRGMPRRAHDNNMKEIQRDYLTAEEAKEYVSPLVVMRNKLASDDAVIQMHKNFKLQNNSNKAVNKASTRQILSELENGEASFARLNETLKDMGAGKLTRKSADELMRTLMVRGVQGPSAWISNLRQAGYVGTIANPYSALLNFGDTANTVVNFGVDNTAQAIRGFYTNKGLRIGVEDVGLLNQATGDFLKSGSKAWQRTFDDVSEKTFELSGFRKADMLGKGVTLNASIKAGQKKAVSGALEKEYSWLFSPSEMAQLKRDLVRGNKTQRVREFAAAELAKLQPSDMAQMPSWYLNNPNGRILYMLRSFGLKQLQQIERLVVEEWKAGRKEQSIKNLLSYLTVVGGGNTLLNELRQPIKDPEGISEIGDPERMLDYFIDFNLGLISVNTIDQYTTEATARKDFEPLLFNLFPAPASMTRDFVEDAIDAAKGGTLEDWVYEGKGVRWLPFMRIVQPYIQEYN
jgi:hypothetical protein